MSCCGLCMGGRVGWEEEEEEVTLLLFPVRGPQAPRRRYRGESRCMGGWVGGWVGG